MAGQRQLAKTLVTTAKVCQPTATDPSLFTWFLQKWFCPTLKWFISALIQNIIKSQWLHIVYTYLSVFEIMGEFQSHGHTRALHLHYVILWQIMTCNIFFGFIDLCTKYLKNATIQTSLAFQISTLERFKFDWRKIWILDLHNKFVTLYN